MASHDHGSTGEVPAGRVLAVKVLTVSDGVVHGVREDRSGAALVALCGDRGWDVVDTAVTADGTDEVAAALGRMAEGFHGLIVTTGGTGFGPRDRTPEGTLAVLDRQAPGLAEAMRLVNPLGRLSRGVAGTLGTALVVNTPGSARGCVECLEAVADVVPHAVRLMVDNADSHPSGEGGASARETGKGSGGHG
jgi:molybdenum cofactor synthesis domain-containing protein